MPSVKTGVKVAVLTIMALAWSGSVSAQGLFGAAKSASSPDMSVAQAIETIRTIYEGTTDKGTIDNGWNGYLLFDGQSSVDAVMQTVFKEFFRCGMCDIIPLEIHEATSDVLHIGSHGHFNYSSTMANNRIEDLYLKLSDYKLSYQNKYGIAFISLQNAMANRIVVICISPTGKKDKNYEQGAVDLRALNTLGDQAKARSQRWADEFPGVVEKYRAMNPKPATNEDIHRVDVVATNAIQGRRFVEADEDIVQGIEANPSWPPFHYNRALILAELGIYPKRSWKCSAILHLSPMHPMRGMFRTRSTRGKQKGTERSNQWTTARAAIKRIPEVHRIVRAVSFAYFPPADLA